MTEITDGQMKTIADRLIAEALKMAVESAKRCADSGLTLTGHVLPVVVVAYPEYSARGVALQHCLVRLPVVFGDLDAVSKRVEMLRIGQQLRSNDRTPMAVAVMFAAWCSIDRDARRRHILPEDDPERTSAVVVIAASASDEWAFARRVEDAAGTYGPWQSHPGQAGSPLIAAVYQGWQQASTRQQQRSQP